MLFVKDDRDVGIVFFVTINKRR